MAYPFVPNIAAGRANELYVRVKAGDPANSRLIAVLLKTASLPSEATLRDCETLADILAAGAVEADHTVYARYVFTAAMISAWAADHSNNRAGFDLPDIDWGVLGAAGGQLGALVLCYDNDNTGGTDANLVPMGVYSYTTTPDGVSNCVFNWNASGVFRATPA